MSENSRARAEELLRLAESEGDFGGAELHESTLKHITAVARAAEGIAGACGMDTDKAYALGLMHDIGKYKGDFTMEHVYNGYEFLTRNNFVAAAKVAMTHTFYNMETDGEKLFSEFKEVEHEITVREFLAEAELDDWDRLIQLADNMGTVWGVTTIEERFCDILTRHKMPDAQANLLALYELKHYFDQKAGRNIYGVFKDELIRGIIEE